MNNSGCSEATDIAVTISLPLKDFDDESLKRLEQIISSKANLIKKVFEIEDVSFEKEDDKLTFDWFKPNATPEEIATYQKFVCKLGEMARNQKRVQAKEKEVPSEKYAWRCFLLRLGMIGEEYKIDRKILLQNLSGSSSRKESKDA